MSASEFSNTFTAATWSLADRHERQLVLLSLMENWDDQTVDRLLDMVRAPKGLGVYASLGPNYHFAIFGRDSLEVGEDILQFRPELAREIILFAASMQGHEFHDQSEEELGKIFHEYRALTFDGVPVTSVALEVFNHLTEHWGSQGDEMCYYGTVDATPLFIRLIDRYVTQYGRDILDETVTDRYGNKLSLRYHLRHAIEWLARRVESSDWGLLEYKRINQQGLPNQAWKDSETSYLHLDGREAWADGGIASIEVQGYAYDALVAASGLAIFDASENEHFARLADKLRTQTIDRLWMNDKKFFAIGLDRSGEDFGTRQIQTLTSNSAAVLDSGLLDETHRDEYVAPIVEMIMSPEFLIDCGVRTRGLSHVNLISFADYHGSQVSWPKETYDIAKGLRRHGFEKEAYELEDRILQAMARSGEAYEYYYATSSGGVKYQYRNEHPEEPQFHEFGIAALPEPGQAWSLSALVAICYRRQHTV